MKREVRLIYWLSVISITCSAGWATGQIATLDEKDGTITTATPVPAEINASRWQHIVRQLQANGLSTETAMKCLAPIQEAARLGLPADPVLIRLEEGAAKGVPANALQEAGRLRLDNLKNAAEVLHQAGYGTRNARHDQLMKSVTLGLESGLSAATLLGVLSGAKGGQSERMRSIVEAGETMRLSGMNEATVKQMMTDFTERNLRRTEVIRASRFAMQQHHANVDGTRIRQQLWDGTGSGGRRSRGENIPITTGSGPGSGAGACDAADRGKASCSEAQAGRADPSVSSGEKGGPAGSAGQGRNGSMIDAPKGSTPNQEQ